MVKQLRQEAREVLSEPDGRWFSFNVDTTSLVILERKDLPAHLASMNCVETTQALSKILREMEDQGEVPVPQTNTNLWIFYFWGMGQLWGLPINVYQGLVSC